MNTGRTSTKQFSRLVVTYSGIRLAIGYTVASVIYIVVSDLFVVSLGADEIMWVSIGKGLLFVVLSGILIGALSWTKQRDLQGVTRKLQDVEKANEDLFIAHPEPMWMVDMIDLRILDVNPAAIEKYGYSREEFLRSRLPMIMPPTENSMIRSPTHRLRDRPELLNGLWKHKTKNGVMLWANVRASSIRHHTHDAALIVASDITEMVDSWHRDRFIDSSFDSVLSRLKMVADSIQDGFFFLDSQHLIVQANPTFCRLVNMAESDVVGARLTILPDWLDRTRVLDLLETSSEIGTSVTMECEDGGNERTFRFIAYPNSEGHAVFFRDITHEKATELQIRREHGRLESVINNTDSIIFALDKDLRLTLYNNRLASSYITHSMMRPELGMLLDEMHLLGDIKKVIHEHIDVVMDGSPVSRELMSNVFGGISRYVQVKIQPIVVNAVITGMSISIEDIHERTLQRERIEQHNDRLRDIARISSHELRGPLTSVMSILALLQERTLSKEAQEEAITELRSISADVDEVIHTIVRKTSDIDA